QRPFAGSALPGVIARLAQFHRLAARTGNDGFYLPGEISNKIAAGNPCRQRKRLTLRIGLGNAQCHAQSVPAKVMRDDSVEYRFSFHTSILTFKKETT